MTTEVAAAPPAAHDAGRRPQGRGPRRSPTSCAGSRGRCCVGSRSKSVPGESYGLVGESGCGKSTTAYAAVRYLPRNGVITGGRILVDGEDITKMSDEQVRQFRIHHASMVYQDPGAALNPTTKIGPAGRRGVHGPRPERPAGQGERAAGAQRVQIADPERSPSATRISFRAGCSSASSSRSRWPRTRSCSSSTSRPPGSMPRSRRACSTSSDAAGRDERGGPAHRPQPRRHPDDVRPGRGDVRGKDRRGGQRRRRSSSTPSTHTPSASSGRSPAAASASRSARCRRSPATCRRSARTCRPASSSTAVRLRTSCAGPSSRRSSRSATGAGPAATTATASGELIEPPPIVGARDGPRRRSLSSIERLQDVPSERPRRARPWSRSGSSCSTARRSGSSASPAPASRPWPRRSSASRARTPAARSSSTTMRSPPRSAGRPTADKRSIQMVFQNPDSALNRGWTARRILARSVTQADRAQGQGGQRAGRQARRRPAPDPAPPRPQTAPAVRRAQAARRDRPRVRRRPARSSSPTSRRARWTSRSRPRSSTCCPSSSSRARRATCSSRTTSVSSATSPTGSRSCTSAGSWRSASPRRSSAARTTRTPRPCCPRSRTSTARSGARILLEGEIPSPANPPSGCVFNTRCHRMIPGLCEVTEPPLIEVEPGHR